MNAYRDRAADGKEEKVRILLVEDDEDDYLLARDLLDEMQGLSARLDWVRSYGDALDAMSANSHDLYLLDYRLGEHNGLELLQEATQRGLRRPAIILTGSGDIEVDIGAMKAGASDYLVKGQLRADVLERSIRYALERQKMLDTLHDMATRDGLTGLKNRRELERVLEEEFARYKRYGGELSLVMVDIDHFKAINDRYGHQMGDEVLRWLGRLLRASVRQVDTVARYGGEEIVLILPETPVDRAMQLAERLRKTVASEPFDAPASLGKRRQVQLPLTISLGVAGMDDGLDSSEALIAAADRALYEAKRGGRNRVVQFDANAFTTMPLSTGVLRTSPLPE